MGEEIAAKSVPCDGCEELREVRRHRMPIEQPLNGRIFCNIPHALKFPGAAGLMKAQSVLRDSGIEVKLAATSLEDLLTHKLLCWQPIQDEQKGR